ncbi:hypothetical protein D9M71_610350 [compost metagenome]
MVDVQAVLGGDGAHPLQLLGGHLAGQQGDHVAALALAADPLLVVGLGNRRETHLLVQLVGGKKHILEYGRCFGAVRNFHQDAERQGVVNHRLADVQDVHAALGEHAGDGRGQARAVFASDVDQDNLAQGTPPSAHEKAHILPTFGLPGACPALCPARGARYTAPQFRSRRAALCEPAHACQTR